MTEKEGSGKKFIISYELIIEAEDMYDALKQGYRFSKRDCCCKYGLSLKGVMEEKE